MVVEIWGREYLLNDHDSDNNYGGGRVLTVRAIPCTDLETRHHILFRYTVSIT